MMNRPILLRGALCAAALVLGSSSVLAGSAQDPRDEPRPRPDLTPPPLRPLPGSAASDPQRELLALFRKVEQRLREIDALLVDAGAGDTSRLGSVGPAGIDQLLQRSLEEGRQNLRDIDRIIEIAQQFGPQSSSGGSQQQDGQAGEGGSPTQRGQQSTQREETPEGPSGREPGAEEGEEGEEGEEPGEQQQPGQGRPQDGGPSEAPEPTNRPGDDPPRSATERQSLRPDDAERWGDLPVKVRDVFRHEGSEDLPPQYRDWIDSYYRRLQREGRRR